VRIAVLANDVIPGMGLPVAAPGLRAWGLALGLRAHGHDVHVLIDRRVAGIGWGNRASTVPPGAPRGASLVAPADVTRYVRTHDIEALVVTNSNHVGTLGDLGRCHLVFDFFAPKMLELGEHADTEERAQQLAALEARKLAALGRSDLVIVNGAKKLDYVASWTARAGKPEVPTVVVNPPVPPVEPAPLDDGRVHAIVSGYIQPWSRPGAWLDGIRPYLRDGSIVLHLMLSPHWGQGERAELPEELRQLQRSEVAVTHRVRDFADFRAFISRCHLSIDVFERNPERELAMVTRTITTLSCGVPAVHVPFTEVSDLMRRYDAGWLVEPDDVEAMEHAFGAALDPATLAKARAGARSLAREVLEPAAATQAMSDALVAMGARA
jgi:hypothetical protein